MQIIDWQGLDKQAQLEILARPALEDSAVLATQVSDIVNTVKQQGDQALIDYALAFDHCALDTIALSDEVIAQATSQVSPELQAALNLAKSNIETFHQAQKPTDVDIQTMPGVRCELRSQAIKSVGLYTPGGTAPLPSTVLMTAIPAKIAGCEQIVLCSPPPIDDVIIYTAALCGVTHIYQVGGAQAIAAMAYGTECVPKVDKVFGPGNKFVTEAKKQVAGAIGGCAIDMPAGPSEVLVIADAQANPAFVAADLLSQAEHGSDSQTILVTDSQPLASMVAAEIESQLLPLSRQAIATQALKHSRLIVTNDLAQSIAISNCYAPEHLIIQTQSPRDVLEQIYAAGSVFLGAYSPESAGDYASGTNHVLPTYGMCNSYSSLGLADFSRRFTVQELSKQGLTDLAKAIVPIANAEGLDAHANAVTIRLKENASD